MRPPIGYKYSGTNSNIHVHFRHVSSERSAMTPLLCGRWLPEDECPPSDGSDGAPFSSRLFTRLPGGTEGLRIRRSPSVASPLSHRNKVLAIGSEAVNEASVVAPYSRSPLHIAPVWSPVRISGESTICIVELGSAGLVRWTARLVAFARINFVLALWGAAHRLRWRCELCALLCRIRRIKARALCIHFLSTHWTPSIASEAGNIAPAVPVEIAVERAV